jgi:hypothetical protein
MREPCAPITGERLLPRVIVTGSRDLTDPKPVRDQLDRLLATWGAIVVIQGGCPTGADLHARTWAADHAASGVISKTYDADWKRLGLAAGPARNARMVGDGAHIVLGFLLEGAENKGTRNCLKLARAAKIRRSIREIPRETPDV